MVKRNPLAFLAPLLVVFVGTPPAFSEEIPSEPALDTTVVTGWLSIGPSLKHATGENYSGVRGALGVDVCFPKDRRFTVGGFLSLNSAQERTDDVFRSKVRRISFANVIGYEIVPRTIEIRTGFGASLIDVDRSDFVTGSFGEYAEIGIFLTHAKRGLRINLTYERTESIFYSVHQRIGGTDPLTGNIPTTNSGIVSLAYHF